jgi:hypothetical protein
MLQSGNVIIVVEDGITRLSVSTIKAINQSFDIVVRTMVVGVSWVALGGIALVLQTAMSWIASQMGVTGKLASVLEQIPVVYIAVLIIASVLSNVKDTWDLILVGLGRRDRNNQDGGDADVESTSL